MEHEGYLGRVRRSEGGRVQCERKVRVRKVWRGVLRGRGIEGKGLCCLSSCFDMEQGQDKGKG